MERRVPDLVRDSELETYFPALTADPSGSAHAHPPVTVHVYHEAGNTSGERDVRQQEAWRRCRWLAQGAFGSVWLEECVSRGETDRPLRAVKQIPRAATARAAPINYHRELEAIAKFSHPKYQRCFVRSLGWYEWQNALLVSMEYLPHGDLQDYLDASDDPLPEGEVQQIAFQLLEGLSYMHDNGFEHRDLKPRNALIKSKPPESWWIKIGDFGISKRAETAVTASVAMGTPGYIAPEIYGALPPDDNRPTTLGAVDMWALGRSWSKPFPASPLSGRASDEKALQFIQGLMKPFPGHRFTVDAALKQDWVAGVQPGDLSPLSMGFESMVLPDDGIRAASIPGLHSEPSGVWTTLTPNTAAHSDDNSQNQDRGISQEGSFREAPKHLITQPEANQQSFAAHTMSESSDWDPLDSMPVTPRLPDNSKYGPADKLRGPTNDPVPSSTASNGSQKHSPLQRIDADENANSAADFSDAQSNDRSSLEVTWENDLHDLHPGWIEEITSLWNMSLDGNLTLNLSESCDSATISPNGRSVICRQPSGECTVRGINLGLIYTITASNTKANAGGAMATSRIELFAVSLNSKLLAISNLSHVWILKLATGRQVQDVRHPKGGTFVDLTFSRDSQTLFLIGVFPGKDGRGTKSTLQSLSVTTGLFQTSYPISCEYVGVVASPIGQHVAVDTQSSEIHFWDIERFRKKPGRTGPRIIYNSGARKEAGSMASRRGCITFYGGDLIVAANLRNIQLLMIASGAAMHPSRLGRISRIPIESVNMLVSSLNGRQLAITTLARPLSRMVVWHGPTLDEDLELYLGGSPMAISFSPNGSRVASVVETIPDPKTRIIIEVHDLVSRRRKLSERASQQPPENQ